MAEPPAQALPAVEALALAFVRRTRDGHQCGRHARQLLQSCFARAGGVGHEGIVKSFARLQKRRYRFQLARGVVN